MRRRTTLVGAVALVTLIALPCAYLHWGLRRMAEEDANINMKYILVALLTYADSNSQSLPEVSGAAGLVRLFDAGVFTADDRGLLHHPLARRRVLLSSGPVTESEVGFYYAGGHRRGGPADTAILVEKRLESKEEGYVGYLDGRVLRLRGQPWRQIAQSVPAAARHR